LAVRTPVAAEPLGALLPLHAPDAVQVVAFVDDQPRLLPLPLITVLGLAVSVTVGIGGLTETVAD
jgi:hypothetical protein